MNTEVNRTFDFAQEALKIAEEAREANLTLRVLGATAFRIHSPGNLNVHDALGRTLSDLDFAGYSKERAGIEQLFTERLGFETVRAAVTPGLFVGRCIFIDKSGTKPHVDVFLDRLDFNHVIDFNGRLELDFPTIPLADLLLEKLQIVHINEKDIKDSILLLLEHDVGEGDRETINMEHIVNIMSENWGFYYTATMNLKKLNKFLTRYDTLTEEQRNSTASKIENLLHSIENVPKTLKWKFRAKVGTSKRWYNEVEEVERAEHLRDEDEVK